MSVLDEKIDIAIFTFFSIRSTHDRPAERLPHVVKPETPVRFRTNLLFGSDEALIAGVNVALTDVSGRLSRTLKRSRQGPDSDGKTGKRAILIHPDVEGILADIKRISSRPALGSLADRVRKKGSP